MLKEATYSWQKYKDGTRIQSKVWDANWGPEVTQFYNMLTFLKNSRGVTDNDLLLGSYSVADPAYWTVYTPWRRRQNRFFVEQAMIWIRLYKILEASNSRAEFLDTIGLDENDVRTLLPNKLPSRRDFPAIAEKLGKTEKLNKIKTTPL